jgi:methionyl-tRNA formyltransferase
MKFGWVGFHMEGIPALEAVLASGAPVAAVLTLKPEVAASRSGAADYGPVCRRFGVPLHFVTSVNDPESRTLLAGLDVVFVIGWSQILSPATLATARLGMIGAHASLLPKNRGSAPINWALIRGERVTGNSLIWLAEGVDAGDIIDQTEFQISPYDTCGTLYDRVAASNRDMIMRALPQLLRGERVGTPQPRSNGGGGSAVLPRRRPADGLIDWDQEACAIYNFIRALTKPYPGAFGWLDGRRWTLWRAGLLPTMLSHGAPSGHVLGPVVSPVDQACGQAVACAGGAITLLEVEGDDGTVYSGRRLAELPWTGRRWSHA